MKTTGLLLEDHCPHCGRLVEFATVLNKESVSPEADSVSLCLGCASISVFDEELRLRPPSEEEFQFFMTLPGIQAAILAIAIRNRRN